VSSVVSEIVPSDLWEPTVLGWGRLNERWCAYLVEAPFDMPADADPIVGTRVTLHGMACKVGGTVVPSPPRPIRAGEPVQILVRPL
jgi:hypothetical protein